MKSSGLESLAAAAIIALVFLVSPAHARDFTLDKVLATVDNEPITLSDYLFFADGMGIEARADKIDEALLKKLLEERVILAEARRRGVEVTDSEVDAMIKGVMAETSLSSEEFERELAKEGMKLARYRKLMRDRATALKLIGMDVDSKVIVDRKEIEEYYRANRRDYLVSPARVEVKAIFMRLDPGATVTEITDLKRKTLRIVKELKEGIPFESLAARYGEGRLRDAEGRPGVFEKGALIPELDRKAFSMNKGEISDPVWVSEGVYILKLEDKTEDVYKPLEEVKDVIEKQIFAKRKEKLFNGWMRTLWEKSSVVIN